MPHSSTTETDTAPERMTGEEVKEVLALHEAETAAATSDAPTAAHVAETYGLPKEHVETLLAKVRAEKETKSRLRRNRRARTIAIGVAVVAGALTLFNANFEMHTRPRPAYEVESSKLTQLSSSELYAGSADHVDVVLKYKPTLIQRLLLGAPNLFSESGSLPCILDAK
ncbi:MAG: hypothetical protein JWQ02_984 [Capsulimonas sp.]|nr:hypothetical protein [Capsulimonas sp.]